MEILFVLIPLSFILIGFAVYLFFWAVKDGQFDDMDGSAHSILFDDDKALESEQEESLIGEGQEQEARDSNEESSDNPEKDKQL